MTPNPFDKDEYERLKEEEARSRAEAASDMFALCNLYLNALIDCPHGAKRPCEACEQSDLCNRYGRAFDALGKKE